jgi:hypothetical protein
MITGIKNRLKWFFNPPVHVQTAQPVIQKTEQEEMKEYLLKKYGICQLPTIDLADLFPDFNETVNNYTYLEGTSLVTDIALLKSLARKFSSCSYLEIGSWRGESLSNVAEVAKKCVSITLSAEELRQFNISEEFINAHGMFTKHLSNVTKIEHNSQTFDFNSLNEKFDLVFIDGDHSHKGVMLDTQKIPLLIKDDTSVVVWHDYGNYTERVNYITLAGILDGLPQSEHKYLYHVSNTICAVMIKKELKSYMSAFPTRPNKTFSLSLQVKKIESN